MTNKERAEKIATWVFEYLKGSFTLLERERLSEVITFQFDEAVKEAEVVRVVSLAMRDIQNFEDGFAAAQEKAIQIFSKLISHHNHRFDGDSTTCSSPIFSGQCPVEALRAMKVNE